MNQTENITELLKKIEEIPELPQVACKILEEATKENCDYNTFAKYIEASPSLMLKIFQIINSPYYGFPNKITKLSQAIGLLGIKKVVNIALTIFILDIMKDFVNGDNNVIFEWKFLITVSTASKVLTKDEIVFISTIVAFLPSFIATVIFKKHCEFDFDVFINSLEILGKKWFLPEEVIKNVKNYYIYKFNLKNSEKNYIYLSELIGNMLILKGIEEKEINKVKKSLKLDDASFVKLINDIENNAQYIWNMFGFDKSSFDYTNIVTIFSRANHILFKLIVENDKVIHSYNSINKTLNVALNNIPLAVFMFENSKLVLINDVAKSITKKNKENITSMKDIFSEDIINHLVKSNNKIHLVTETIQGVPVEVMYAKIFEKDKIIELFFLKDLTEEFKFKKQYKNLKENYASIINSAGIGICLTNTDNKVLFVNKKFCQIFKGAPEKFIDKKIHQILCISETCLMQILPVLKQLLKGRIKEKQLEVETRDLKNKKRYLDLIVTLYKEGSNIIGFQFIINDITKRKELELENLRLQDEFLKFEKDKIAMELAGATAHELNQPLTSLLLAVEMLKEHGKIDNKYLNNIEKSGKRIAEIVKKIGEITKYETRAYIGKYSILDIKKNNE